MTAIRRVLHRSCFEQKPIDRRLGLARPIHVPGEPPSLALTARVGGGGLPLGRAASAARREVVALAPRQLYENSCRWS